jgi:hypothetical protein
MPRLLQKARETPSAVLLIVQLSAVLIYPFIGRTDAGRAIFAGVGIIVLFLAVLAIRPTPSLTWMSLLVAFPALVLLIAQVFSSASWLYPWSAAFEAALYFYAAIGLIRHMFADHIVTTDELFAIGATFTLVAWAFAYVYVVVQAIWPLSFTAAIAPHSPRTWMELLFLSFTTLSSTGLSDVVPILLRPRLPDARTAGRRPLHCHGGVEDGRALDLALASSGGEHGWRIRSCGRHGLTFTLRWRGSSDTSGHAAVRCAVMPISGNGQETDGGQRCPRQSSHDVNPAGGSSIGSLPSSSPSVGICMTPAHPRSSSSEMGQVVCGSSACR